jgi:peptidoglycan/xylan/chitin deacetylase (PgdA/CDA1 family)
MEEKRSLKLRALDKAAAVAGALGGSALLAARLRRRCGLRYLRVLAYHSVGDKSLSSFQRQLGWLAARYEGVDSGKLAAFLSGEWNYPRPGLILSFDDGLLDNYRVAAPALEAAGLRGWFFIPSGLPGPQAEAEERFCAAGELTLPGEHRAGERVAMSWDEIRDLAERGHEIGCHTASHCRLRDGLESVRLEAEIGGAKRAIEKELGRECRSFAFVGGEPDTYSRAAYAAVRGSGFRYAFTTLSAPLLPGDPSLLIHRTVLDPDMDFELFKFKVSGFSDLVHAKARGQIAARLESGGETS